VLGPKKESCTYLIGVTMYNIYPWFMHYHQILRYKLHTESTSWIHSNGVTSTNLHCQPLYGTTTYRHQTQSFSFALMLFYSYNGSSSVWTKIINPCLGKNVFQFRLNWFSFQENIMFLYNTIDGVINWLRGSEATEKKRLMALQEVGESSHRSLSFFEDALLSFERHWERYKVRWENERKMTEII
jgi:hypothetical protein